MPVFVKVAHCREIVTWQLFLGKYKPDASISTHKCNNITSYCGLLETTFCLCAQPPERLRSVTPSSLKKLKLYCKVSRAVITETAENRRVHFKAAVVLCFQTLVQEFLTESALKQFTSLFST